MEKFLSEIIRNYLKVMFPDIDATKYVELAKTHFVRSQSTAGAWIELPDSAKFPLPSPPTKHIWSGLVANVNGEQIIDILAYTEGHEFLTIELASPLDDYPDNIEEFEFTHFPNQPGA